MPKEIDPQDHMIQVPPGELPPFAAAPRVKARHIARQRLLDNELRIRRYDAWALRWARIACGHPADPRPKVDDAMKVAQALQRGVPRLATAEIRICASQAVVIEG
jgi:hypothetical protein